MSGFRGLARAPRLLGFGLLVGFSGALLVVSALDMVCDCHLGRFCGLGWLLVVPVGPIGPYWPGGGPFRAVGGGGGGLVGCVQGRELGARASPSEVYPAGKLH